MSATYRISADVGVRNPGALWTMASDLLANVYGLGDADIVETIGPPEDPDICQCMTMLLDPSRWSGCVVETLECAVVPDKSARSVPEAPRVIESSNDTGTPPDRHAAAW